MSRGHVRRSRLSLLVLLLPLTGGFSGCPGRVDVRAELADVTWSRLEPFASAEEFDRWANRTRQVSDRYYGGWFFGCADAEGSRDAAGAPKQEDENITNNQEQGVDEGGIVKVRGDHLIVLRRGRLFTIRRSEAEQDVLQPVSRTDAYPPGSTDGTWYDEMLVHGSRVIVIGFSYRVGATEIGLFDLGDDGTLTHVSTHFLRSNDYYSSRNYASRLIGDKLVLYIPAGLFAWEGNRARPELPAIAMRTSNASPAVGDWNDLLDKVDVIRPIRATVSPVLHTVVQCDLAAGLSCTARAVAGTWGRTFYVSRDAVYLWVGTSYAEVPESLVYRLPLGEGEVTAVSAQGMPLDQFSFKEADGHLNVAVLSQGGGDGMWAVEGASGDMALLRTSLDAFSVEPRPLPVERYRRIPVPASWSRQNRFVGDWYLYGSSSGGWRENAVDRELFAVPVSGGEVHRVALAHSVERIEALGRDAIVVGARQRDLVFTSVSLGEAPQAVSVFSRGNAEQGENRSHGFFFRPNSTDGGGILGLPVRLSGGNWASLRWGSAEVQYLTVKPDLSLVPEGVLRADGTRDTEDECVMSCVDWYGNARPIFLGERILALMGYELVEGALGIGGVQELRRVNFLGASVR